MTIGIALIGRHLPNEANQMLRMPIREFGQCTVRTESARQRAAGEHSAISRRASGMLAGRAEGAAVVQELR